MLELGCIPTKALLKISSGFDYLKHASDYGLTVSILDKDFLSSCCTTQPFSS
jgi:dihydrolipoamide dehydrogenase